MTDRNKGSLEALDTLKEVLTERAKGEHRVPRFRVALFVPARLERVGGGAITDPEVLKRLDGLSDEIPLDLLGAAEYRAGEMDDEPFPDVSPSVEGGDMVFRYDRSTAALTLVTEYSSHDELNAEELEELK